MASEIWELAVVVSAVETPIATCGTTTGEPDLADVYATMVVVAIGIASAVGANAVEDVYVAGPDR